MKQRVGLISGIGVIIGEVLLQGAGFTYFVQPEGSGTGCTKDVPCTLQTALAKVSDHDRIVLRYGTYIGTGSAVMTIDKNIAVYGSWDGNVTMPPHLDRQAHTTIIDAQHQRRDVSVIGDIYVHIEGLDMKDGNATELGSDSGKDCGGGLYVVGANVAVENCSIHDSIAKKDGGGIYIENGSVGLVESVLEHNNAETGGGIYAKKGTLLIENDTISGNHADEIGGGIYMYSMHERTKISNSRIMNNEARSHGGGITIASTDIAIVSNEIVGNKANEGGGIELWYSDSDVNNNIIVHNVAYHHGNGLKINGSAPRLVHNTISENSGFDGIGIFLGKTSGDVVSHGVLIDNIIAFETVGVFVEDESSVEMNTTLWWANGSDISGTFHLGRGNLTGNTAFRNRAVGDYHLTLASMAVDAGVDAGIDRDIDGNVRPSGNGFDIGADEFLPAASNTAMETAIASFLADQSTFAIDGTFGAYDFADATSAFDWAYTSLHTGKTYQLQGNAPSEYNVFGWKEVQIEAPRALWYMVDLGADADHDGSRKFDWVLFSTSTDMTDATYAKVYKLLGVRADGRFRYSQPLDVNFTIEGATVRFHRP